MKKLLDLHVHTGLSPDGQGKPQAHYDRAVELGLSIIGFSDHLDYEHHNNHSENRRILGLINENFHSLETVDTCKPLLGIELAYQQEFESTAQEDISIIPELDFIIGSIHEIDKLGFSGGPTVKEFFNKHRKHCFTKYFDTLAGFAENGIYDVVGHFDIIKRFSNLHGYTFKPTEYKSIIQDILSVIISRDKGIEINASGVYQPPKEPFPDYKIVEWFFELGGKWLTVGSDSHTPENVGRGCKEAMMRLSQIGVDEITYFEKRKPQIVKLI